MTDPATAPEKEIVACYIRPTWRIWQRRIYRTRGRWEWGWVGNGWNVLRLGHGQGLTTRELMERGGWAKAEIAITTYSHVMPLDEVDLEQLERVLVRAK